jgi:hypothetical protein
MSKNRDALHGIRERVSNFRVGGSPTLKSQKADHELKIVAASMVRLAQEQVVTLGGMTDAWRG